MTEPDLVLSFRSLARYSMTTLASRDSNLIESVARRNLGAFRVNLIDLFV